MKRVLPLLLCCILLLGAVPAMAAPALSLSFASNPASGDNNITVNVGFSGKPLYVALYVYREGTSGFSSATSTYGSLPVFFDLGSFGPLKDGDIVSVAASDYFSSSNWAAISHTVGGSIGVISDKPKKETYPTATLSAKATVYESASKTAKQVDTLSKGTAVTVTQALPKNPWVRITYNGGANAGYVEAKYVNMK